MIGIALLDKADLVTYGPRALVTENSLYQLKILHL